MIIVMIVRCDCNDGDVDSPLRVLPRHCQSTHPRREEGDCDDRHDDHDYHDYCDDYHDYCDDYRDDHH